MKAISARRYLNLDCPHLSKASRSVMFHPGCLFEGAHKLKKACLAKPDVQEMSDLASILSAGLFLQDESDFNQNYKRRAWWLNAPAFQLMRSLEFRVRRPGSARGVGFMWHDS